MRKIIYILLFISLFSLSAMSKTTTYITLFPIIENGKWGYINKYGRVLIKPKFDYAYLSSEEMCRISDKYGKFGYCNKNGKLIISPKFSEAYDFKGGLARVKFKGKYTYINKKGKITSAAGFDEAMDVVEKRARVRIGDREGFVGANGKIAISLRFLKVRQFYQGLAPVLTTNSAGTKLWGYLLRNGKYYHKPQFLKMHHYSDTMAAVVITNSNNKWGFIDAKGKVAIPPQYDDVRDFHSGLAAVKKGGYWGYINKHGEIVISNNYSYAGDFHEGIARVNSGGRHSGEKVYGGRWGLVNNKGEIIAKPQFDWISEFKGGLARLELHSIPGFINNKGKFTTNDNIDCAFSVHDGLARVKVKNYYGYITKKGKFFIKIKFKEAGDFVDGLAKVLEHTKHCWRFSYINGKGKSVWSTTGDLKRQYKEEDIVYVYASKRQHSTNKLLSSGMDMWKRKSVESKKITTVPYGKQLLVVEKTSTKTILKGDGLYGYWTKIDFNETFGYVFDAYLLKLPTPVNTNRGIETYFDENVGIIRASDDLRINQDSTDIIKKYHYGIEMQKQKYYNGTTAEFKIPDISMQDVFVLMKSILGFPEISLKNNYANLQKGDCRVSFSASMSGIKITQLRFNYYSPNNNHTIEIWKQDRYIIIKDSY